MSGDQLAHGLACCVSLVNGTPSSGCTGAQGRPRSRSAVFYVEKRDQYARPNLNPEAIGTYADDPHRVRCQGVLICSA